MQMCQALATGIGDSPYLEKGDLGFYTIQYCSKTSKNWYYITYSRTWYKDENGVRRIAYCVDKSMIERAFAAFEKLAESYGLVK